MFERIKRLYSEGKLTKTAVNAAVKKKWITKAQAAEITAEG